MTGLYSPINKLMEQVTRPKGTGAEYMAELQKKPGYKPAEAEDRDLQALMALPQMERAAFMEKLKAQANKYPLKHRELTGSQTHHERYTLPGGENYREILLHTPMPEGNGYPGVEYHFGGTPNILASIRVKDRITPGPTMYAVQSQQPGFLEGGKQYKTVEEARAAMESFPESIRPSLFLTSFPGPKKKTLHIEEIQSDWHQEGREKGYLNPNEEHTPEEKKYGIPYGPHAKDWHELALKAMIQHAAEKGYDQLAITPGAEQAKRFGLSKHVGSVSYNPETQHFQAFKPNRETITNEKGASPERIKALIGKDAAAKLMQAPKQMGHHYLEGEDLNIGGEGMKGFYDKMVPTFLNKFGKKHGVQVQPGQVATDKTMNRGPQGNAMVPSYEQNYAPVHTFDITPAMREDVLKNGIPRYAEGGEVDREEGLRKFLEPSKEKRRMYHGTRHYTRGIEGGHPITSPEADPNYTEKMRNTGGFAAITPSIRGMSFVTPDTEFANEYAGENKKANKMSGAVYPVHVQVKNPFDYENPAHVRAVARLLKPTDNKWAMHYGKSPEQIHNRLASGAWEYIEDPDVMAAAKKLGHDAMYMNEHGVKNLGVFNPNVIKSAIGNRGTYDINEPHMNKAEGGNVSRETADANKAKFLKGSKVSERVYHGTGNLENLQSFDPTMTGKGTDQLGSGFYFTNKPETASGYATSVTQNAAPSTPKLGGNTSPGMVAAHLAIKKPLKIGPKGNGLNDARVNLTHAQVKQIMMDAPNIMHPEESPLGNHVDISRGVTPKMVHDIARLYTGNNLHALENDIFRGSPTEYRTALHKATGYDGVVKEFGNGEKHYVAWFPHQIKSAIGNRGTYDTSNPDITKAAGGIVKEKVTISPNMDAMQYELMGVKHFTKKAK